MLSDVSLSHVEASCDWLTRTFSDERVRGRVYERAQEILELWVRDGKDAETWDWMGYSGFAVGGMSWGHRDDSDLLRLSGGTAELLFDSFANHVGNCSRLDIALTFTLARVVKGVASRNYRNLAELQEPAHTKNYSLIVNNKGGETLYVGSRRSDQFGRVYDKNAEEGTGPVGERWRYEVEFKAERASRALTRLTSTEDRRMMYVSLVYGFFMSRNVALPSMPRGLDITIPVPVEHKSADRQLAWLRRQVRPVVDRLIAKGLSGEVMAALGLEGSGVYASKQD